MAKLFLIVVHEGTRELRTLQQELARRYAADYEIVCESSAASALQRLGDLRAAAGMDVLAVFAADAMAEMTGIEFLQRAHQLHPHAQRVLLVPRANRSAAKPILRAISLDRIDRYAAMPDRFPDEDFHYLVTELLRDWQQKQQRQSTVVTVVGERWAARSHEFRDLLQRSGLPFVFHASDSDEGRALWSWCSAPKVLFPCSSVSTVQC